jgi:Na+(H+)/acetate symporter ActP
LVATAGSLACLIPVGAWTLLLVALGLAATALAPAAVLACWSERVTPQGAAVGASVGLVVFLIVAVAGQADGAAWWGSVVAAAPAVVAAPVHLLVAWLLRTRRAPSSREGLPPGLEQLSLPFPAQPWVG